MPTNPLQFYLIDVSGVTITLPDPIINNMGTFITFKCGINSGGVTIFNTVSNLTNIYPLIGLLGSTSLSFSPSNYQTQLVCSGTNWYQISLQ